MLFNNRWQHSNINSIFLDLNAVFICGVSEVGNDFMHDVSIHETRHSHRHSPQRD